MSDKEFVLRYEPQAKLDKTSFICYVLITTLETNIVLVAGIDEEAAWKHSKEFLIKNTSIEFIKYTEELYSYVE